MKPWNLTTGATRLELALEGLRKTKHATIELWNDAARRHLEEDYLLSLEPRMHRALDGIHRLQEILSKAQRECGEPNEI